MQKTRSIPNSRRRHPVARSRRTRIKTQKSRSPTRSCVIGGTADSKSRLPVRPPRSQLRSFETLGKPKSNYTGTPRPTRTATPCPRTIVRKKQLLLVSLSLEELPLLVLAHLLAALFDDTTHDEFSLVRAETLRPAIFRDLERPCQASSGRSSVRRSGRDPDPQARENVPMRRLLALPRARFSGWRRGRKGTIGRRRRPREAIASRIG